MQRTMTETLLNRVSIQADSIEEEYNDRQVQHSTQGAHSLISTQANVFSPPASKYGSWGASQSGPSALANNSEMLNPVHSHPHSDVSDDISKLRRDLLEARSELQRERGRIKPLKEQLRNSQSGTSDPQAALRIADLEKQLEEAQQLAETSQVENEGLQSVNTKLERELDHQKKMKALMFSDFTEHTENSKIFYGLAKKVCSCEQWKQSKDRCDNWTGPAGENSDSSDEDDNNGSGALQQA